MLIVIRSVSECPHFTTMYGDAEKGVPVWVLSVVSISLQLWLLLRSRLLLILCLMDFYDISPTIILDLSKSFITSYTECIFWFAKIGWSDLRTIPSL